MDDEILEKYKKAGKISVEAKALGIKSVKAGITTTQLADMIEKKIFELGGKPAFPVSIGINEMAAHYAPLKEENIQIREEDYVKIDLGVHIDGYIVDTAVTVRIAGKDDLVLCSEKMNKVALPMFRPGTKISEISEAIENVAKEFKFNPIRNLTGHSIDRFMVHAGEVVPNTKSAVKKVIEEGEVYACEPFCTTGWGMVKEGGLLTIFRALKNVPSRMPEGRKIMELAFGEFESLPFAKRWLQDKISPLKLDMVLRQLLGTNALHEYPVLKEVSGKPVAQTEETILTQDKPLVLTQ
ncbi:MAG TPA: type II methionyl aminopeptidase [archaeon]|nr:type II methionyl aminopeptidase [archaeon]